MILWLAEWVNDTITQPSKTLLVFDQPHDFIQIFICQVEGVYTYARDGAFACVVQHCERYNT